MAYCSNLREKASSWSSLASNGKPAHPNRSSGCPWMTRPPEPCHQFNSLTPLQSINARQLVIQYTPGQSSSSGPHDTCKPLLLSCSLVFCSCGAYVVRFGIGHLHHLDHVTDGLVHFTCPTITLALGIAGTKRQCEKEAKVDVDDARDAPVRGPLPLWSYSSVNPS